MTMQLTQEAQAQVAQVVTDLEAKIAAGIAPLQEEVARMATQLKQGLSTQREARRLALLSSNDRPRVPAGKYQGLDQLDLATAHSLLKAQLAHPQGYNGAGLTEWDRNLKAALDSTTVGAGDELVPTQEARQLWMDVNLQTAVASLFTRIEMPSNPFEIPLQLGDVNWYPGTENAASKSTSPSTKKQTLTAYELVAEIPWSLTLDEDAVIAMMPELRAGLVRNGREIIDDLVLNADTTVTNGINSDGATIAATDAGKGHWLIGFDGLIHLPIVDNTAQATDHNAAVNDDMFNQLRLKLAKYAVRPQDCAFITDINTFIRSMSVANLRTLDKYGPQATILTGELAKVEGVPLIVSEQMLLAAADGKVTDGTAGTVGRLLLVNRSQWRTAFRRDMMIETERDIQKRQNLMVVSFRMAFAERTGTRSTATHTAIRYNITGVT
jgi:HK97 family phage major capsid protein